MTGCPILVQDSPKHMRAENQKDHFSARYKADQRDGSLLFCNSNCKAGVGRSKGWGRVKYKSAAGRQRAILQMHGALIGERRIEVRIDKIDGGISLP